MILTGKAKKDFIKAKIGNEINLFESMLPIYKNALIIEWFDDIGLWKNIVNDTLIFDRYYFKKCSWQSNIELLLITANEIYNSK